MERQSCPAACRSRAARENVDRVRVGPHVFELSLHRNYFHVLSADVELQIDLWLMV